MRWPRGGIVWLLLCGAVHGEEVPDVTPVTKGAPAPFTGYLFPSERAITLANKAELCVKTASLDAQLCSAKAELAASACQQHATIAAEAAAARQAMLQAAFEAEQKKAVREVWEQPWLLVSAGVVGGIGITVGAVLLVAQLRPAIPK